MKRFVPLLAALLALAPLCGADVVAYDKPRSINIPSQFRFYREILPQTVPTSLTAVVTQTAGCSSAVTGGTAVPMTSSCGVYLDMLVISCPSGSAGTVLVQDFLGTPMPLIPTIATTAQTLYTTLLPWYWLPGGFQIRQVTGSGCTYSASWGVR